MEVDTVGKSLKAHEVFGTVEAVKTVSDLFMPLDGEILEVNPSLDADPASVNNDPYGAGWMIRIKIASGADLSHLLDASGYQSLL